MNTAKAEDEDPDEGENNRNIRAKLRRQSNKHTSIPSPSRSPSPQIPKVRKKLGHAPQSICETGLGCGSRTPVTTGKHKLSLLKNFGFVQGTKAKSNLVLI